MIKAMIFDLDGTLVQTEKLKARSYARAAVELCPHAIQESEVIEAFKAVVGLSRQEVSSSLLERFDLEKSAREKMAEYGVKHPWQVFAQVRMDIYQLMLTDPQVIINNQWPHNLALLEQARRENCKVGLATMSHKKQTYRILDILKLNDAFDFVATREDVLRGKPDPEMYLLVSRKLDVDPRECLVVEDSPSGVQAAVQAGMNVVAISTPFTREGLHDGNLLPQGHIVDSVDDLERIVDHIIQHAG